MEGILLHDRDREQLIVLPLIAILLPLIVMGGRVVSGIAIVLSGRLATILLPLIVHNTIVFI